MTLFVPEVKISSDKNLVRSRSPEREKNPWLFLKNHFVGSQFLPKVSVSPLTKKENVIFRKKGNPIPHGSSMFFLVHKLTSPDKRHMLYISKNVLEKVARYPGIRFQDL
jgi:hypothetical protein